METIRLHKRLWISCRPLISYLSKVPLRKIGNRLHENGELFSKRPETIPDDEPTKFSLVPPTFIEQFIMLVNR